MVLTGVTGVTADTAATAATVEDINERLFEPDGHHYYPPSPPPPPPPTHPPPPPLALRYSAPKHHKKTRRGWRKDQSPELALFSHPLDGRMHAGHDRKSCGGVGRNVADALIKLGACDTRFISVVGNDEPGTAIFQSLKGGGGTLERSSDLSTANCTVIVDAKGECCFIVGELDALAAIDTDLIRKYQTQLEAASIIVMDANLPAETMALILDIASHAKIPG
ncbi:hypothetical protein M0802_001961 [Mischocyttarus mexicanus]|nr:hypothetical protein M0802_001961 [Mischocyttarus mexicanus]